MAQISTNENIMSLLKTYYKDGVENLMFRNSPVVKEITKERVEGKAQNFSAMIGRGGAVGGNYIKAKKAAASVSQMAEFSVTPGQIFSVYTMSAKEVQASKTLKGAYAPVAGAKMFAAQEAFRKTIAATFYGSGYGELCQWPNTTPLLNDFEIELPIHAVMAIDIGSELVLKTNLNDAESSATATLTVKEINGNTVKFHSSATPTPKKTDYLCLAGSVDENGNPVLPVGLAGWLPSVANRKTSAWTNYIAKDFFNVKRSRNPDRLAGAFFDGSALNGNTPYSDAVEGLMQKVRRQGGVGDLIVMNDEDWRAFAKEIQTTNTYFTQTSTKGKREANVGFDKLSASFSTNYIENIWDDPYCPKGTFYILDKEYVKLWSYTNLDKLDDGVAGNNPGKPEVMEAGDEGAEDKPYGLIIDDYLNVKPGEDSEDGPVTEVSIIAYFAWVVTNPANCGVGKFKA